MIKTLILILTILTPILFISSCGDDRQELENRELKAKLDQLISAQEQDRIQREVKEELALEQAQRKKELKKEARELMSKIESSNREIKTTLKDRRSFGVEFRALIKEISKSDMSDAEKSKHYNSKVMNDGLALIKDLEKKMRKLDQKARGLKSDLRIMKMKYPEIYPDNVTIVGLDSSFNLVEH